MNKSFSVLVVFFPLILSAQPNSGPVGQLDQAQKKIKALSTPGSDCGVCNVTMTKDSSSDKLVCEDLFAASCLGSDGQSKYKDQEKALTAQINQSIKDARNKAAVELGFKDFNSAVKAKLKDAGIAINENPERFDNWLDSPWNMEGLVALNDECQKDFEEIDKTGYLGLSDVSQLKEIEKKVTEIRAKYNSQSIALYSQSIPDFIKRLQNECDSYSSDSSGNNGQKSASCKNLSTLKRKAVELFRIEDTPGYKKAAEAFVKENMPESKPKSDVLSVAGMSEASKIKADISANNSYQVCGPISNISQSVSQKILEEFKTKTQISKTMVESVVDSIYGQDKKKIAEAKFSSAKSDIQSIVTQFVKDPKKKKEIIDGYSKLNLYWMEKPADSAYMKNSDGVLVLDESKAASQMNRSFSDDIYGIFSDHNLSKLTELNANYMPPVFFGKGSKYQERVNISPVILSFRDKYPNALLVVLAHEAGHKIGPEVTKINKYDLSSDYKNLLACYKDSKSINLQSSQVDETIADYLSSEVLARELSRMPSEKRVDALKSSMALYCIVESGYNDFDMKEAHPENSLRVSGIYGANPNIRSEIGCQGESSKYKTCGLSDVSIPKSTTSKKGGSK